MDIELRHVRCYLAVAQELSFTRAAELLRVSQPSLSRTVSALEQIVGARLLDRTTRKVRLTPEGERLKVDLERWLHELDGILMADLASVPLRLGFTWLLPDGWAQQAITLFEQATKARVELVRRDEPYAGVLTGDTDIAVLRGVPDDARLRTVVLFQERRVAAVSRSSPLAQQSHLSWVELASHPLVVNMVTGTTQPEDWPVGHRPTVSTVCGNFDEWFEAVAAGRGVGVVPVSAVHRVMHPAICFIPVTGARLIPVHLAYPRQGFHPLAPRFVRAARGAAIPSHASPAP